MQPLNHLRIIEPEVTEDELDLETALELLNNLSQRIGKHMDKINVINTKFDVFNKLLTPISWTITLSFISFGVIYFIFHLINDEFIWGWSSPGGKFRPFGSTSYVFYYLLSISSILILLLQLLNFSFTAFKKCILKYKFNKNLRQKKEEYFSILMPINENLILFQNVVNRSHLLMDSPDLNSWQKIELSEKILGAEETLIEARKILMQYDPSLLPK